MSISSLKLDQLLTASLNLGKERSFHFGCKLFQIRTPLNCNAFFEAFEFIACAVYNNYRNLFVLCCTCVQI